MSTRLSEGNLVEAARRVWDGDKTIFTIRMEAPYRLREWMKAVYDWDIEAVFLTDSDFRHIKRRHGKCESSRGQIDIVPEDFSCIPEVLANFDSIEHTDTDKLGNRKFLIVHQKKETVFMVTVQRGKRKLEVKTFWKCLSGASC